MLHSRALLEMPILVPNHEVREAACHEGFWGVGWTEGKFGGEEAGVFRGNGKNAAYYIELGGLEGGPIALSR